MSRLGRKNIEENKPLWHSTLTAIVFLALSSTDIVALINHSYAEVMITDKSTQCFSDANQAYAYLLAQQAQQQYEQQAARDSVLVNINTATEGELTALDGIGSSKAQAIIVYREAFGKFASVDELTRVKGIGEKTLEKNRQRLTVQ
ncbi:ComEA family DNA-binding protein [Psychrobacter sp. I-STPA10]|uniref:ComEA family DNA-binding protein n=1 Tax=Psychrobacter sp. I-STPA10 TaxID=2585769 RepID=UPI001E3BD43B|nr:ComEA family DNA-binding protein [Psychrobacter sp. I-STPA10]